jgi:hypothetical protein
MFAQDEWRAADNLTLTYGLRYEFFTVPYDTEGRVAGLLSFDDLESGPKGVTPGSDFFKNPSKLDFAPRLGVAWKPFGNEKLSVKAGTGVFYQPLTTSYYRGTTFRVYPYFAGVDIRTVPVFGPPIQLLLAQGTGLAGDGIGFARALEAAGSVPDDLVISGFGLAISASREEGALPPPPLAWPVS